MSNSSMFSTRRQWRNRSIIIQSGWFRHMTWTHLDRQLSRDSYFVGTKIFFVQELHLCDKWTPSSSRSNAAMADAATVTHSITESPHSFLQPSSELHHASRLLAKNYLDPLASSLWTFQQQRQKFQKKRKRSEADVDGGENLRLQKLYVDDK